MIDNQGIAFKERMLVDAMQKQYSRCAALKEKEAHAHTQQNKRGIVVVGNYHPIGLQ